jgi:hypothetical protein
LATHEYFKQLAAIAALGELSQFEVRELQQHLAGCTDCKHVSEEYVALHLMRPALGAETLALIESRRESVKAGFLARVAAQEAVTGQDPHSSAQAWPWINPRFAWSGLAAAVVLSFVFWLGIRYERDAQFGRKESPPVGSLPSVQSGQVLAADGNLAKPPAESEIRVKQLEDALRAEKQRTTQLYARLSARDQELSESQQERLRLQQQFDAQTEEVRSTESLLATKAEQLKQMEMAKANDSDAVVALRYQVQDLTERLNEEKNSLDRERQLLASGRDIRDIIGARNLHIIDVYDTDPDGNTKKSFARAFYTEGTSLIFYAYDLPSRRTEQGKYAYAAWGERNGNKEKVLNLGILLNDDKGQKRWVLNFSDPKVLAEIDSVFVTLERVGFESDKPTGKRLLTAYLASAPNHP